MKYANASAFRAALEARLKNRSDETGTSLSRLRKSVVFDRLLARLVAVAPGKWVLKGALALEFRFGNRTRTTKDVDIGRADDEEAATKDFVATQQADLGDHFVFSIERTGRLDDIEGATAVRYHVSCELAGRTFDEISVDVAFGAPELRTSETLQGPSLLDFADIRSVEVPAIPLARHVAEKVHAYTRAYGKKREPSTRVKDLVDLVLIASEAELDALSLRQEFESTFRLRATHELPARLPPPPDDWSTPFRRLANEIGIPDAIADGHALAARMIDPILAGQVSAGTWGPTRSRWQTATGRSAPNRSRGERK